jgi:hypothetical protein
MDGKSPLVHFLGVVTAVATAIAAVQSCSTQADRSETSKPAPVAQQPVNVHIHTPADAPAATLNQTAATLWSQPQPRKASVCHAGDTRVPLGEPLAVGAPCFVQVFGVPVAMGVAE